MSNVNFPEGWELSPMSNAIAIDGMISDGDWIESKDQDPNGAVRLIQLADIGDGSFKNKSERFMSHERAEALNCTFIKPGDILIARMPDPLGRACLFPGVGQDAVTVVDICLIRTGERTAISNRLLTYWINSPSIRSLISANASGTTRKRITRKKMELFEVPIPPLAEQKIIADKLDTLLAQVETTKARLERIPEILKTFRQSVLTAAVSGKLTKEWREENNTSIKHWLSTNVGSLAEVATGKTPKRTTAQYWEGGSIPWLTSAATGKAFTNKAEQFVTKQAVLECSLKIFPAGTLLLAMYGEGKTRGQVTEIQLDATCNQACAAILVDETKVSKEFLKIRLQENYEETRKAAVGGAQPNLNLSKVREIPVALPTESEQLEIVRRVKELFAFADNIEVKNNTALFRVNKITQSILEKAFRGEVTADWRAANPDLFSGDSSAGALLAKIKVERDAIKKQSNPKRTAVKKKTGSHMRKQIIKVVEALKKAGKPLNGQQLLAASGYPGDSCTDQLEQFFLDIREALATESIIKLERGEDGQDWFALAERDETKKA